MAKIDHPLFGHLGAFWINNAPGPFYSLKEAKDYQWLNGGDILNWQGDVLYTPPEQKKETLPKTQAVKTSVPSTVGNKKLGFFAKIFGK